MTYQTEINSSYWKKKKRVVVRRETENSVMIAKNIGSRSGYWFKFCPCLSLDMKLDKMLNFFELNVLICKMRINNL